MLYGRTPFRGKNRQKTFANIIHKDLTFPSSIQVTLPAKQLIHALLNRDPASRLGSNGGANEIKEHPFFKGINWPLIRCMVWSSKPFSRMQMHEIHSKRLWLNSTCLGFFAQSPPPLDAPLEVIGKEDGKDVNWTDEGVLEHPMEMFQRCVCVLSVSIIRVFVKMQHSLLTMLSLGSIVSQRDLFRLETEERRRQMQQCCTGETHEGIRLQWN